MTLTAQIQLVDNGFGATLSDGQQIQRETIDELADALVALGVHVDNVFCGDWTEGEHILSAGQQIGLRYQMRQIDLVDHTVKALTHFTRAVKESGLFDCVEFVLFGSRARGNHRVDSDADVAVVLKGAPGDFYDAKLQLLDIAYDTLLAHGLRISPLPVWENELAKPGEYSNPDLLKNIINGQRIG